jgi:hypothetical protein
MTLTAYLRSLAVVIPAVLMPTSLTAAPSCRDIHWNDDVLAQYPDVKLGCLDIVEQDGQLLAHFEARLVRARRSNGEVTVSLKLSDGNYVDRTFHAPPTFRVVTASGSKMSIFDIDRGETLDILISGNNFSVVGANDV